MNGTTYNKAGEATNQHYDMTNLTFVEMSIITAALQLYAREAYGITNNIHHTEAAEELSNKVTDLFCEEAK